MKRRGALLAGLALAACGSTPEPRVFTLVPMPGAAPVAGPSTVAVRSVGLAKYLDRPQIVRSANDVELHVTDLERWAEPLGDMIGRVLVDNLSQRLRNARVFQESGPVSVTPAAVVELEVSRFDLDSSGTVRLQGQAAVRRANGRVSGPVPLDAAARPAGTGAADLARAMSEALGTASDRIATLVARG